MTQTKTHAALVAEGYRPGDVVFVGSVVFGDEDEPCISNRTLPGFYRDEEQAKGVVATEVAILTAREVRDGWWTGDVDRCTIVDRSGDWGSDYGWVFDWDLEPDEDWERPFYAVGAWQR